MSKHHVESHQKITRIEALSDGVYAILLTLLILDVIHDAERIAPEESLAHHLLELWPTFLSYFVGFMSILVCWINHHRVFHHVRHANTGLMWCAGLQLMFVSLMPLPTMLIGEHLRSGDRQTAIRLYGVVYWLIALSFWGLWRYAEHHGLLDPNIEIGHYRNIRRMYAFAVFWVSLSLLVSIWGMSLTLLMWLVMFIAFAFPSGFSHMLRTRPKPLHS